MKFVSRWHMEHMCLPVSPQILKMINTHTHTRSVENKWFCDNQKLRRIVERQNADGIGPIEVTPVKDTQLGPL